MSQKRGIFQFHNPQYILFHNEILGSSDWVEHNLFMKLAIMRDRYCIPMANSDAWKGYNS